jgi:hypothetical protein
MRISPRHSDARGDAKKKSGGHRDKSLDYHNLSKVWAKKRSTQSGRPLKGRFDVETNETMPYLVSGRLLFLAAKY